MLFFQPECSGACFKGSSRFAGNAALNGRDVAARSFPVWRWRKQFPAVKSSALIKGVTYGTRTYKHRLSTHFPSNEKPSYLGDLHHTRIDRACIREKNLSRENSFARMKIFSHRDNFYAGPPKNHESRVT